MPKMEEVGTILITPTIIWQLNVKLFEGKDIGDELLSPTFCTAGFDNKWRLELHPKGWGDENKGHLSVFLRNIDKNAIRATYSFSILNQENIPVYSSKNVCSLFDNDAVGVPELVREKTILNPRNKLLVDNQLMIVCNIITADKRPAVKKEIENCSFDKRLKLLDRYETFFKNEYFSDVTITAEGKHFHLHKVILAAQSSVFHSMFSTKLEQSLSTFEIKDVKGEVLNELFKFIYSGKVDPSNEIVCQLSTAARKFNVKSLTDECEKIMSNRLARDNAVMYLSYAITNNAEKLVSSSIKCISSFIEDFLNDPEFEKFGIQNPTVLFQIMRKAKYLKT